MGEIFLLDGSGGPVPTAETKVLECWESGGTGRDIIDFRSRTRPVALRLRSRLLPRESAPHQRSCTGDGPGRLLSRLLGTLDRRDGWEHGKDGVGPGSGLAPMVSESSDSFDEFQNSPSPHLHQGPACIDERYFSQRWKAA